MPLKLNVGLSQKVGLPHYGSLGASCHVEVELDQTLFTGEPETFQNKIRQVFGTCRQAVQEELDRQARAGPTANPSPAHGSNGQAWSGNGNGARRPREQTRPATASQVRAIESLADRQHVDLTGLLRERFGAEQVDELLITEASRLIDELKAPVNGKGGG